MEENKNPETELAEAETIETEAAKAEVTETIETEVAKSEVAETENTGSGKKQSRGMVSTRNGLYLRTVIGGLILYYAYTILADIGTAAGTSRTMLYVFVAVFGIAGIWIVLDSLKRLFKKEYDE